ncbi:hypothetical protein V7138_17520 [Bacillus sp. JJ1533]|uniref:hypothetical protein n=1 Tax=Bacillus sp. JJ1533 TaxID=3122959 RepID=UPI002FFE8CB7
MSSSFKYLCVVKQEIFEIPKDKIREKFIKKEFAGQSVLRLELTYGTKNRKPNNILRILFDSTRFDGNGVCDFRRIREDHKRTYDYIFNEQSPLPIPKALVLPTVSEIIIIKQYLNNKYPTLLKNDPYAIETAILDCKERYKQNVHKFKRSHSSFSS